MHNFAINRIYFRSVAFGLLPFLLAAVAARADDSPIDFARDVRPLLSDACFHCHGPDASTREADLRLDTQNGLFTDLGYGAVVDPGSPAESELYSRISSDDPDLRMPPAESNKSLSDVQRETLRKWIAQGAPWQEHWSFAPPEHSAIPDAPRGVASHDAGRSGINWGHNPIDSFVKQRLEANGLTPNSPAEPYTLVRRLYLDLNGVLPTPAEADKWVRRIWDDGTASETEYQRLVDELLSSPRYGERWARRWLDLARYADTNGYEKDRDRTIWPYRDWVVQAINSDMPFDQFTVEQLAGDMLPNPTESQIVATGFHRNTMLNEEGGIDPLEFRYHAMTDRVATTGTTWLGLTLGCCQCHTHKYDPITHTEYFGIMALINNADEPQFEVADPRRQQVWAQQKSRAKKLLQEMRTTWKPDGAKNEKNSKSDTAATTLDREAALQVAYRDWLKREKAGIIDWSVLEPTAATANLPILTIEADNSIFASGDTAKRDDYWIDYVAGEAPIHALRLEALADERLPAGGPGSTYYEGTLGDFFLTEFRVLVDGKEVGISSAEASYENNRYGSNPATAANSIDGDIQTGWSVHDAQAQDHVAVYKLREPIAAGTKFQVHMSFGRHFASSLGRFRMSGSDASGRSALARTYSKRIARLIADAPAHTTLDAEPLEELLHEFLLSEDQFAKQAAQVRKLLLRPRTTTTLVMRERPANQPRPTFRHHRGEYLQPREAVTPALPEVLLNNAVGDETNSATPPKNRLEFARWLVSSDNPLTARVVVNRHWAALMGQGIVKTVDDFGLQGEPPSHPELLDWLAVEFANEDAWSIKSLHRRIATSATYRQSSSAHRHALSIDPENRLLWRASRHRLDAEVIRDSLLAASGILVEQTGGPPVKPPQPKGVTEVAYGSPKWEASTGKDRFRRSIYTKVKRTAPFAMFTTFDAPSGEACIARRSESNSPLQALTLLNDPMIAEYAQRLAEDVIRDAETEWPSFDLSDSSHANAVATTVFRRILTRPPAANELRQISQFLSSQLQEPDVHNEKAETQQAADKNVLAVASVARALIALDETLTRN